MKKWLFSSIDNSPLIIFRIIFGLLIILEAWGAILTGWVRRVLIEPKFTFNFIHLDFLQPLPNNGMYFYFFTMGLLGIFIMIGYRYLISMIGFTILWACVYLMQKSSYNNHYYLLALINIVMCILPANKDLSFDKQLGYTKQSLTMPKWCSFIIISQLFIVYTYASLAKFYPDWLNTTVVTNLMARKKNFFLIGEILQQKWIHYIITYTGILFDLFIIPALLYKPTRKWAFRVSLFFHLYNSFVLHIGIFPYLALAFSLFFFEGKLIRKWFYPKKQQQIIANEQTNFKPSKITLYFITIWILIQVILPLRHHFIKGDVLWTEEGHRLSWRMMLRSKGGQNTFYIVDKETKKRTRVSFKEYLTKKQKNSMAGKPDMLWQFAQHLKKEYQKKGKEIEVYVYNKVRVNKSKKRRLISPKTDLAAVKWNYWGHNDWIIIE